MSQYPHLKREKRTGNLQYRRRIPIDVRAAFDGKHEVKKSFGTMALAEALPVYHEIAAATERRISTARTVATVTAQALTTSQAVSVPDPILNRANAETEHLFDTIVEAHLERCRRDELRERDKLRELARREPERLRNGELMRSYYAFMDPMAQYAQSRSIPQGLSMNGAELLMRYDIDENCLYRVQQSEDLHHLTLQDDDLFDEMWLAELFRRATRLFLAVETRNFQEVRLFCARRLHVASGMSTDIILRFGQAERDALMQLFKEFGGFGTKTSSSHVSIPTQSRPQSAIHTDKLSVAVQKWVDQYAVNQKTWTEQRRHRCERVLSDFVSLVGDRPIDQYTKADGRDFKEILYRLPANIEKRKAFAGLGRNLLLIAESAAEIGMPTQSETTIRDKLRIARQCFNWIANQYDEVVSNPIPMLTTVRSKSANEDIDPFNSKHIAAIFSAPPFVGCRSERSWLDPGEQVLRNSGIYWVPLIGFFSGMRSNEICQLRRDDIRRHGGVYYIALTPKLMLKNASSVRNVPLHRGLLDLGFLKFLETRTDRLFPDIPQHSSGRYSDAFGKKFARLLKSLNIKTKRLNFHSFRHLFDDLAHLSRLNHEHKERILGHALQGQAGRYGKNYRLEQEDMELLKVRNEEMQTINFDSFDLAALRESLQAVSGHATNRAP